MKTNSFCYHSFHSVESNGRRQLHRTFTPHRLHTQSDLSVSYFKGNYPLGSNSFISRSLKLSFLYNLTLRPKDSQKSTNLPIWAYQWMSSYRVTTYLMYSTLPHESHSHFSKPSWYPGALNLYYHNPRIVLWGTRRYLRILARKGYSFRSVLIWQMY